MSATFSSKKTGFTTTDTSKREQMFMAWGKNLCTKQSVDQGLVLNILQAFFRNSERNLILKEMLNFLSFLVLLNVSGNFKQNKI